MWPGMLAAGLCYVQVCGLVLNGGHIVQYRFSFLSAKPSALSLLDQHPDEDRLLLYDGKGRGRLAVGMTKRFVLRQPLVPALNSFSPLAGNVRLQNPGSYPMLEGTMECKSSNNEWVEARVLRGTSLVSILRLLKDETPLGSQWGGALAYECLQWTQPVLLQHPPISGEVLGVLWLVTDWHLDFDEEVSAHTGKRRICSAQPVSAKETDCVDQDVTCTDLEHSSTVKRVQKSIRAGFLYQMNFARTWSATLREGGPAAVFRRVVSSCGVSLYSGYLEVPDLGLALVCSSPELLLKSEGGWVSTAPIKGTRPRGENESADEALRRDLENDEKERAEHRMIVDLELNELRKVCSVATVESFDVLALSNVQHMVSMVKGLLDEGKDGLDALNSLFPGGSITGCPKVAALGAIDELEGKPRSFWSGSMGWFDPHSGDSLWNIMIRTLVARRPPAKDGGLSLSWVGSVSAGGGLTIQSSPAAEVFEAVLKATDLRQACGWPVESNFATMPKGKPFAVYALPLERSGGSTYPESAHGMISSDLQVAFIENNDSFSESIVHLLRRMGASVSVFSGMLRMNDSAVASLLAHHGAVILGPGPGRPEAYPLTMALAAAALESQCTPTLGVCLGHQALGLADGMQLVESPLGPVHGAATLVRANGRGLLPAGISSMVRYNSLVLEGSPSQLWVDATDVTGLLAMALSHREGAAVFGVQFHPESAGSLEGGSVLSRFLEIAVGGA